jgi:hypothetical protein
MEEQISQALANGASVEVLSITTLQPCPNHFMHQADVDDRKSSLSAGLPPRHLSSSSLKIVSTNSVKTMTATSSPSDPMVIGPLFPHYRQLQVCFHNATLTPVAHRLAPRLLPLVRFYAPSTKNKDREGTRDPVMGSCEPSPTGIFQNTLASNRTTTAVMGNPTYSRLSIGC